MVRWPYDLWQKHFDQQKKNYCNPGTLSVLLGTTILVGGCLGCLLDNLIPGSRGERGLDSWENEMSLKSDVRTNDEKSTYDFPYGMSLLYR